MNTATFKLALLTSVIALLAAACAQETDALNGARGKGGATNGGAAAGAPCVGDADCASGKCDQEKKVCDGDAPSVAEALQCNAKPDGARSYALFDGTKLEDKRTNENVGVNRARIKPFAVLASEYQRVLGLVPASVKTAGGSFDAAPDRWFAEATYSGVSMNAIFDISFDGCLDYARAAADLKALPTQDTATTECTKLMRKAWSRSPSPDEITGCTDLAVTKLATQTDVARRWAYVCSSVLSSSQFLTF